MKQIPSPTLYIRTTNSCNLNCSYCNQKSDNDTYIATMNDMVTAIERVNPGKVIFTGGEPIQPVVDKNILDVMRYYNSEQRTYWRTEIMSNLLYDRTDITDALISYIDYIQTTWRPSLLVKNSNFISNLKYIQTVKDTVYIMLTLTEEVITQNIEDLLYDIKNIIYKKIVLCPELLSFDDTKISEDEEKIYYANADMYMMELFSKLKLSGIKNDLLESWRKAFNEGIPLECNVCYSANAFVYYPSQKEDVFRGCPCILSHNKKIRKRKYMEKCKYCDLYDICKLGCERFGKICHMPKNTIRKFVLDQ